MNLIRKIELIERIDQLIRMQATGTPIELALKLGVSKTKLYRTLSIMKKLDAPIEYNTKMQSFVYKKAVNCHFGFYNQKQNTLLGAKAQ